jgi:D-alanine-D-alanine ligase
MKKLRIAVLVREGHVPPDSLQGQSDEAIDTWKAEFDVVVTLKDMHHEVQALGVYDDLTPLRDLFLEWKPDITFMLLEEFHGVVTYDHAIISYLELMQQAYTGCNPRGLLLSKDKALSKKILAYHRIRSPKFAVFPRGRKVRRSRKLEFPLFVKSVVEDASLGISQASIVRDDEALAELVRFVHEHTESDAIAEQYIEGRELYVGVLGNDRLVTFPPWEMRFDKMPDNVAHIATRHVKWNRKYQERHGIMTERAAGLTDQLTTKISKTCKRVYRALHMSGYARMDLRLTADGRAYVIEANANPNIEYGEDFAESAENAGISYEALLQRILKLGLSYQAPWQL